MAFEQSPITHPFHSFKSDVFQQIYATADYLLFKEPKGTCAQKLHMLFTDRSLLSQRKIDDRFLRVLNTNSLNKDDIDYKNLEDLKNFLFNYFSFQNLDRLTSGEFGNLLETIVGNQNQLELAVSRGGQCLLDRISDNDSLFHKLISFLPNSRRIEVTRFLLENGLNATNSLSSLCVQEAQGLLPSIPNLQDVMELLLTYGKANIVAVAEVININFRQSNSAKDLFPLFNNIKFMIAYGVNFDSIKIRRMTQNNFVVIRIKRYAQPPNEQAIQTYNLHNTIYRVAFNFFGQVLDRRNRYIQYIGPTISYEINKVLGVTMVKNPLEVVNMVMQYVSVLDTVAVTPHLLTEMIRNCSTVADVSEANYERYYCDGLTPNL